MPKASPKSSLMRALAQSIFNREHEHHVQVIDDLVGEQIKLMDNGTLGFIHRGEYYTHSSANHKTLGTRIQRLHPSLRNRLDQYLAKEEAVVGKVRPVIMGYLRTCLTKTLDEESLCKLLPQIVHPTIREWHENTQAAVEFPEACKALPDEEIQEILEQNKVPLLHIKGFKARALIMS